MKVFPANIQEDKQPFGVRKIKPRDSSHLLNSILPSDAITTMLNQTEKYKPKIGNDIQILINCWEEGKNLGISFIAQHDLLSVILPFRNPIVETYNISKNAKANLSKAEQIIKLLVKNVTEHRIQKIRLKRGLPNSTVANIKKEG